MKNLEKFLSILDGEVDGLLLTSRYSRHYGAEFDIAEGMAVVSKKGCRYFTDSRYIESARKNLKGFEVQDVLGARNYPKCINEAIEDFGITCLGYEENYLTVAEFMDLEKNLKAKLLPCNARINGFRGVKEPWEIELMRKAQKIADKAFMETLPVIKAGMTELELQAELIYRMYKNGAQGLSFDPIVVSGPNTSMPHGVAGERVIREGDFITMDFGVLYQGYCSDTTRTVAVGYATEEMKKVYQVVLEAQLAGIAATKAGVTGEAIDGAARKVIADAGYGGLLRPQLWPQPGTGDPRGPQPELPQPGSHPRWSRLLCRARHLSARKIRRPHRRCDDCKGRWLRGYHQHAQRTADCVNFFEFPLEKKHNIG